jgi:hypothetical protein
VCSPAGTLADAAQTVKSNVKADQAPEGAAGLDERVAIHGRVLQGMAPTMRVCSPLICQSSRTPCLADAVGLGYTVGAGTAARGCCWAKLYGGCSYCCSPGLQDALFCAYCRS